MDRLVQRLNECLAMPLAEGPSADPAELVVKDGSLESWLSEAEAEFKTGGGTALDWLVQVDALLDALHAPATSPDTSDEALELLQAERRQVLVMWTLAGVLERTRECGFNPNSGAAMQASSIDSSQDCRRREEGEAATSSAENPTAATAAVRDTLLLLALFFAEFSSASARLVAPFSSALGSYFQLTLPVLYRSLGVTEGAAHPSSPTEFPTLALLLHEVQSLVVMVARRLELFSYLPAPHHSRVFHASLVCLRVYYTTVLDLLAAENSGASHAARALRADLIRIVRDLVAPLSAAVAVLAKRQSLEATTKPATRLLSSPHGETDHTSAAPMASALLLSTLLRELEQLLWHCREALDRCGETPLTGFPSVVGQVVQALLEDLLRVWQTYVQAQQRLQVKQMAEDDSSARYLSRSRGDPFSSFSVQCSLQSLLSAALRQFPAALFPSTTTRAGAAAALASLGGAVEYPAPAHVLQEPLATETVGEASEWTRGCQAVFAAPPRCRRRVAGGGETTEDGLLEEGEVASGGTRYATSFGRFTAAELTEMVLRSVQLLPDVLEEREVAAMHRDGLQEMQRLAALAAQREELERRRTMEQADVEAIPAEKLLERANTNIVQTTGSPLLSRAVSRHQLQKAAFSSVLRSYSHPLRESCVSPVESEAQVRAKQALIARCLVQLPRAYLDAGMDELLSLFRRELELAAFEVVQKTSSGEGSKAKGGQRIPFHRVRDSYTSHYALVLQVTFTCYAALAPTQRHLLRMEDEHDTNNIFGSHEAETEDTGNGAGDGHVLQTEGSRGVALNMERPASFLLEGSGHSAHDAVSSRKRAREHTDTSRHTSAFFSDDTPRQRSLYSHFICRVLELLLPVDGLLLFHYLLEVPALTRAAWHYIYERLCLSPQERRCKLGFTLLTYLAVARESYRRNAIQLLLQLCLSPNAAARRLSIEKVGYLLAAHERQPSRQRLEGVPPRPLIDAETVSLLVQHAKEKVVALPGFRLSDVAAEVDLLVHADSDGDGTTKVDWSAPDLVAVMPQYERERDKLTAMAQTHLGLFPLLCLRQPSELLPSLLEVYEKCVERNNPLMARLLLSNADIPMMIQHMLSYDPDLTVTILFPLLRRYCRTASLLVQSLLRAIMSKLRELAEEAEKNSGAAGMDAETLRNLTTVLLAVVKAMWEASVIPLQEEGKPVLHDFRFLAPFVPFLSLEELHHLYLPQFLYFVQTQLELQRLHEYRLPNLKCNQRQYVLSKMELKVFISTVLKELFLKHPVQPFEKPIRRLKRVELLTYLHYAPFYTERAYRRAQEQERAGETPTEELFTPPVHVVTTKEILNACFDLVVSVPTGGGAEMRLPLFGLAEIQKTVKPLMQTPPQAGGIPSQLMATLLYVGERLALQQRAEFLRLVLTQVLEPFARQGIWEQNPQLWKGALLFIAEYYEECRGLLVQLPDDVLIKSLKEHPVLHRRFRSECENNATFGHILQSL